MKEFYIAPELETMYFLPEEKLALIEDQDPYGINTASDEGSNPEWEDTIAPGENAWG